MSGQPPRVRRNASPGSTKQGPLRATLPVSLMRQSSTTGSPTRNVNKRGSPSKSPTYSWSNDGTKYRSRQSPDERRTACSPGYKVGCTSEFRLQSERSTEKSKTLNIRNITTAPIIRRTASLDTIYLAGQFHQDAVYFGYCGRFMMNKATQTPEEWEEQDRKKGVQKKASVASGDQLEMKFIRQRLQRTNQNRSGPGGSASHQRHSPIQGDHSAISTSAASTVLLSTPPHAPSTIISNPSTHAAPHTTIVTSTTQMASSPRTFPIPIPHIPKSNIPRMRNSVEGLNQEIERLVLKDGPGIECELERVLEPTPEGHRAPIADLFRATHNANTQTPAGCESCSSSGTASRSHSTSPLAPLIPGLLDSSFSPSTEGSKGGSPELEGIRLGTSPQINKFLAREPPDGCEKVKIMEDARKPFMSADAGDSASLKPSMNFVLLPSQSSAFYPLYKELKPLSPTDDALKQTSPAHSASERQK